jgi:serine/threonine protein kinase
MSPHLPDDVPPPQPPDAVEALAVQFLAQLQAGENPDRQALVRTHSHLADRLERRLALAEMVYRMGLAPQLDASGGEAIEQPHSSSVPGASHSSMVATIGGAIGPRGTAGGFPDYEVLGELGHGGMGVVYKARQISLNRIVALKMIGAGAHASPQLRARFHIEAEAVASLQHPNIVQVYEVGEHDNCPYMAMEFLDGGSLDEQLAGKPQPPRAAAALVETLARAMHCAHQRGIIHRDLKPANILLHGATPEKETKELRGGLKEDTPAHTPSPCYPWFSAIPKITDFGLAKRLAEGKGQTSTGAIIGTPSYMAPEQARGRVHDVGPATDVYALGALLYEMLTGLPPFRAATSMATLAKVISEEPTAASRLCPKLPRDLDTICLKCLEKEPAKRYVSAEVLADDLRRFLDGVPIAARPVTLWERSWKWTKRRPAVAALVGVSITAVALLAGSFVWSYGRVLGERDRARTSLLVARRAVDDLYTKMATERLFDEPKLDPLCQELLEKAQILYEELAQEHSADPALRRDTALAWFRLGEIYRLRDGPAAQAYGQAITQQEALHREAPAEPAFRQDLANSHNWLAELLREQGRTADEAEHHYRAALELQQGLADEFPDEPTYRMELARSYYNLGILQRETNRLPEARQHYNRAVDLLTELHATDPAQQNYRQDLARALINRGSLYSLTGRPNEAGLDYAQAIKLLAQLKEEFPIRGAYRFELALARQHQGNLLWRQGRHSEAQGEHRESLALLQALVADFSSRPRYQKDMANALKNLGSSLALGGDPKGAAKCWNQARALAETLVKKCSDVADYQALLGRTLGNLAWLQTEQENWPEARRLIDLGLERMRLALQPNPIRPDYLKELRSQYQDLAETCVRLGDHRAAVKAAANLAGVSPDRPQDAYNAACFVARSIPLALHDNGTGEPVRQELARSYIEQAIAFLGRAAGRAGPDLKRLPNEKQVLEPLQVHPQFTKLMRELDARTCLAALMMGP